MHISHSHCQSVCGGGTYDTLTNIIMFVWLIFYNEMIGEHCARKGCGLSCLHVDQGSGPELPFGFIMIDKKEQD